MSYTGLSEGSHGFLVRAVDAAGNADGTAASHAWRIDTTPPRTTITSGPSGATNATSATFGFTSDDPGATYECGIDGGLFSPCASPVSYTGLTERTHTFAVRGIDAARNREGTPATRSWTVDLTPPDTTIRSGPPSRTNATTATFDFTSDAGATFECSLDGGPFTACASTQSFPGLAEGAHSLQARATDTAGNVDATPAGWSWTVDLTPPDTSLTLGPVGVVTTTSATFEFIGSETGGFECSLDGSVFTSCVSPKSYSGMTEGPHTFTVRAVDAAGNVDPSPSSRTWTVDTAPPDTTVTSGPASVTNATTASFTFTATEPGSFECSLDGGAFDACTSPRDYSGLGNGSHTFRVRALDTVGNADPTPASRTWTVDITPPETTITAGPAGTVSETTATFTFTSSESGTFECALDSVTFTACTSPKSYTGLTVGTHTFSVRAIDAVNNTDPTPATRTWTITVPGFVKIRVMAANTTSGNLQSYDPGHGIRIFQGLKPDIVLIQEFNYGDNSAATIRAFVDSTFGPGFYYYRQPGMQIPNGIISRYPIIASGFWDDTSVSNRDFAWARIDIPGSKDLWAVSLHLLTTDSSRPGEATQLVNYINANVPAGDYLVVGGDLNTDSRTETCMNTLSQVVVTSGPYPVDQNGTDGTNASRTKPYDWVLADTDLNPLHVPAVIGSSTYSSGLVFDSRVYTPLSEVSPVLVGDSGATNMQHQAVVKDFSVSTQ
ncbi:MAG TPA: endonuclease/exonuclease/phosphatase family protein [Myxococcaceae bacterium]|nr:endonuclease/exonuclease/phosphatase family protein [Myxococcaceae bacterium]